MKEPMARTFIYYIGIAETTFKKRYSNHKRSFNLQAYENDAELSK